MRIAESRLRQLIREELSSGSTMRAWHGSSRPITSLRIPAFLADEPTHARWFAIERRVTPAGFLNEFELDVHHPARTDDLIDAAQAAGVDLETEPYFEAPEISEHSPYEGSNPLDLVYIPRVRDELRRRGFDSVRAWDLLERDEIQVWIILDPGQARHIRSVPVE